MIGGKNMSKKNNDYNKVPLKVNMNLSTTTIIIICLGIVCVIVSNILLNAFTKDFLAKYYVTKPILDIINVIGSTLFSAGVVSILVEISTIKGLVSNALDNVLEGNIPLDSYSNDKLEHINNLIAAKRGNVDQNFIKNSIYSIETKLIDILNGLYYDYYNASYIITPDRENNIFKKNVILDYEIINLFDKDNKVSHSIALYDIVPNMTEEMRKEKFKITKFKINTTDLSDDVDRWIQIVSVTEQDSVYQYVVRFERELQHCKSHKIHIEFDYEVTMSDTTQTFRLRYPCKSTNHNIHIQNIKGDNEHWTVSGTAFTSFYYGQNDNQGMHIKRPVDTNIEICFDNWCIPGAGYSVYFIAK